MRDLREYSKQTLVQLVIGGLVLIVIIAEILIYLFYGKSAAISGFICIMVGFVPLGLIWLFFIGLEWLVKRKPQ